MAIRHVKRVHAKTPRIKKPPKPVKKSIRAKATTKRH